MNTKRNLSLVLVVVAVGGLIFFQNGVKSRSSLMAPVNLQNIVGYWKSTNDGGYFRILPATSACDDIKGNDAKTYLQGLPGLGVYALCIVVEDQQAYFVRSDVTIDPDYQKLPKVSGPRVFRMKIEGDMLEYEANLIDEGHLDKVTAVKSSKEEAMTWKNAHYLIESQ